MKIISYSKARDNLRKELDEVVESQDVTCIVSKNSQAVLMSKKMYDEIQGIFKGDHIWGGHYDETKL